jgi:hypothetical protein
MIGMHKVQAAITKQSASERMLFPGCSSAQARQRNPAPPLVFPDCLDKLRIVIAEVLEGKARTVWRGVYEWQTPTRSDDRHALVRIALSLSGSSRSDPVRTARAAASLSTTAIVGFRLPRSTSLM